VQVKKRPGSVVAVGAKKKVYPGLGGLNGLEVLGIRIKDVPYFPGSGIEIQLFHFHDKIKNRTPATVGKTVEEISFEVHMEGIGIIAVMNGTTPVETV